MGFIQLEEMDPLLTFQIVFYFFFQKKLLGLLVRYGILMEVSWLEEAKKMSAVSNL